MSLKHQVFSGALAAAIGLALTGVAGAVEGDSLPEAPAKAVFVRACASCHQPAQILITRRTAEEWEAVAVKMLDRGAQASDEELDQIVAYLAEHFGPAPAATPEAPAQP